MTLNFTNGTIRVAHFFQVGVVSYDPSTQGAIVAIDQSYDLIGLQVNGVVGYSPLLYQNGSYYGLSIGGGPIGADAIGQGTWQHFAHAGLTASDFGQYAISGSGGPHPDFSSTGAPIKIGYLNSNSFSGGATQISGIDNLSLVFHTATPVFWDGGGDGISWNDPNNWSNNVLPTT